MTIKIQSTRNNYNSRSRLTDSQNERTHGRRRAFSSSSIHAKTKITKSKTKQVQKRSLLHHLLSRSSFFKLTKIKANRGSGATGPPTRAATVPTAPVVTTENANAAHGVCRTAGNCKATRIPTSTKHRKANWTMSLMFCNGTDKLEESK